VNLFFIPFLILAGPDEAPEVASNQVQVSAETVITTVADLPRGTSGWISPTAIVIDTEGYCWIRLSAEVAGLKEGIRTGVEIKRTDKGYGVTVVEGLRWKTVERSSLSAREVVPCMSWTRLKGVADEEPAPPKAKTKKGGTE